MKKKMLFVFNPRAGKGMIKNSLADIIDIFVKGGYEVIAHPTQAKDDAYEQVKAYCSSVDMIVCSGGDGTLDEVVTALMDSKMDIPIGYIPAGSTNDFANSLFIPKDMVQAAQGVMNGEIYSCDVGRFNRDTFVYVAAFGLFTDVAYETDQGIKNVLGHVAYLLEGMKRLFDIKSYECRIETEDEVYEGEYIFGMITNSRTVGGFKNLTGKNVDMDDGLFEVTFIQKPKNPLELNEIIGSLLLAEDNTELIHTFKAGKMTLTSEVEIPWTLDGEYGGEHKSVEIENRHHALQIYLEDTK